ncbi:beta-propeller fold lactonase family protein [bacterium]|nr:beta-propeller fold lactonase family protein [bacterium]
MVFRGDFRVLGLALMAGLLCAGRARAGFTTFETGEVRPLAMSPDGTTLFAVNTPDNRLEVFAIGAGGALTHTASVPVGLEPCAVAARSNGEVWVVNHLSDSISIVDVTSSPPHVARTLLVGDEPRDIVFAGTGHDRAFITTAHRGQNSPVNPQLTISGAGRADVWVFDANNLGAALGGTPLTILTLFGDTPRALAASPDGGVVYAAVFQSGNRTTTVSEGAVCDTDSAHLNSNTVQGPCTIGGVGMPGGMPLPHRNVAGDVRPEVGLIVKFDGSHWVDELGRNWDPAVKFSLPDKDVFAISANANPPSQTAFYTGVGTTLFNMAVNPVNGKVYVSNGEARNETRFEGPGVFGGSTVQGRLSEYRITVLDGSSVLPRHLNKHIDYNVRPAPPAVKADSLATPLEMAVTSDGQTLFVVAFGSGKIGVFDTGQLENDTFVPSAANHIAVSGGGPAGLVLDEARGRLYVLTRFDNGISVVDTASRSELSHQRFFNPEPASVVDGRPFLYDAVFTSSNGEASCSSCHIFGDFDSLAWDLGNPDDVKIPNPLPKKLQQVAQLNGTNVDFDFFHPMKGPMTTQTLRGMAHHGAMHWRGDRADQNGDIFNEDIAFRNFRVAFPGLIGRDGQIPESDMQKFSDFTLQIQMPPNPIRNLDNSLTSDQQAGRNFMTGSRRADGIFVGGGTGFNCVGCHTLDASQGFFGADGQASFENETQIVKIAHLRNMYQKVGMFGMPAVSFFNSGDNGFKGDQIRGFGFIHDGSVDTLFRFLQATVFNNGGTFNPVGFQSDTQRRQVEQFLFAFDSDLAPIVGQQVTLTSTNGAAVSPRINLLIARAAAGECDLVVKGVAYGEPRGWVRLANGSFQSDRLNETLSDGALRAVTIIDGQELTYTAVPKGDGPRIGVDRDGDGYYDHDELDAGSDPDNAASTPANITPTVTVTRTATRTGTATATATRTATATSTATSTATVPPPTASFTATPSPVPTATSTASATNTATATMTATSTQTPTNVATPTSSATPTNSAVPSATPVPSDTPTETPTATPTPLCAAAPRGGCRAAGGASLLVKSSAGRAKLLWRWLSGDAPVAEMGDPTATTRYALCAYDAAGLVPSLALHIALAPAGTCGSAPCWQALGGSTPTGFAFTDATGGQQGMQKLRLKGGKPGRDKLLAKAGGTALVVAPPASPSQLFAQNDDVVVQLVTDAGGCFESVFPPNAVVTNRSDLYKAKR